MAFGITMNYRAKYAVTEKDPLSPQSGPTRKHTWKLTSPAKFIISAFFLLDKALKRAYDQNF
jgi:hypothetical protein